MKNILRSIKLRDILKIKVVVLLAMAKGLYKEWLEKDKLILLQGWKRSGLTDEQIAHNMGINVRTLGKWKAKYGQIRQALKTGKQEINFIVENALLKKALAGNTTAMIFFLKNNWCDKYNDSTLSKEERKGVDARTRKLVAEAKISEAQLKAIEETDDPSNRTVIVDDIKDVKDIDESSDDKPAS